jgi:hypothetical protein
MSSKYEREIDEILRKFEDERPPTVRDRVSAMNRRPTPIRSARRPSLPGMDTTFWLVTGIAIAFVAQVFRWIMQPQGGLTDTLIGLAVVIGFVMVVATLLSAWLRGNAPPVAAWRGSTLDQGGRGTNRPPFANLRTRWNLVKLRLNNRRRAR